MRCQQFDRYDFQVGGPTPCPSVAPPPVDRESVRVDSSLQKSPDLEDAKRRQLHGLVGLPPGNGLHRELFAIWYKSRKANKSSDRGAPAFLEDHSDNHISVPDDQSEHRLRE
jgi:hypothetical protein